MACNPIDVLRRTGFFLLVAILTGGAAHGAPYQDTLGAQPLPKAEDNEKFQTGYFRMGHFLRNNEAAVSARPDATGSAYNLYQLYFNDAYAGKKHSFIGDVFALSDRERGNNFNFTQLNYLLGFAFDGDQWNLQFDREESLPLDRSGASYRYWDVRATVGDVYGKQEGSAGRVPNYMKKKGPPLMARWTAMVGYFLHNQSMAARPDGRGIAKMRYHLHGEIGHPSEVVRLVGEAEFLTERYKVLKPVSVHVSYGLALGARGAEVAFLREYREVLDGQGFFPYYMMRFTYNFDSRRKG